MKSEQIAEHLEALTYSKNYLDRIFWDPEFKRERPQAFESLKQVYELLGLVHLKIKDGDNASVVTYKKKS